VKRIAVLAILYLTTFTAAAQAPADMVSASVSFPKSYGAGYSNFAVGASASFWKQVAVKRRVFVGGSFGVDWQRKAYLDSGIILRGSFHARVGLPFGQSWAIKPFAVAGVAFAQQRKPTYTKFGYSPKLEIGGSALDNTLFVSAITYLPDSTENRTRGWGVSVGYFWRLSPRLSLHTGIGFTRFRFYQPTGANKGWLSGSGFSPTIGVTWHLKPQTGKHVTVAKPEPLPGFKPMPMLDRRQDYAGEFELQFMRPRVNP